MKVKGILISATALVIALTVIICVMANSGVFNPYEHQLSLAQKFLEEGNYKEAIIAFNKAIEIDSKKLDTYFALAEVYFENLDDLGGAKETLQRAYENTSEDSVAEKYIEFADRLTAKGKNTDAMELLNSGFDLTKNEEIKSKVGNMLDNLQLDDVTDTMSEELKEDFKEFIATPVSSMYDYVEISQFDKYNPNYKSLIFNFVSENTGRYLASKGYQYTTDFDNSSIYNPKLRISENEMDWVLKNYYNVAPDHNIPGEYLNNPYESYENTWGEVEYHDGYYYSPMSAHGFDSPDEILIDRIYKVDETKYYISYKFHFDFSYDDQTSDEWYETYCGVFERKNVDGLEFWSFIKTSEDPISLRELWEKENN